MSAALASAILLAGAPAPAHHCAFDAMKQAQRLLAFHFDQEGGPDQEIDTEVKVLPPLKALAGTGKFDVLEVWGFIYKGEYRMRFIYARIPDACVLMGQEIIEASDPY